MNAEKTEAAAVECCRTCFSLKFCASDFTPFFSLCFNCATVILREQTKCPIRDKLSFTINVSFKAPADVLASRLKEKQP